MLNRVFRSAPRPAGRHRAAPRRRRLAVTAPGLAIITIVTLAALGACSSGASSSAPAGGPAGNGSAASGQGAASAQAPNAGQPAAGAVPSAASSAAGASGGFAASGGSSSAGSSGSADNSALAGGAAQGTSAKIIAVHPQLVYTAQLTVRAKNVDAALSDATSIVTASGGYVSGENSTGQGAGRPASSATASVTFKIPAAVYPATLARLTGTGLGTQLSLQQQAQDVTQQVADVGSQVTSDNAAISQLRALLKDAGSVSSLLVVQDQINTETSDLESMLAQQQALDHETAYATVTLTLVGPKAVVKPKPKHKPTPPPGLASGLTGGWRAFRLTIDWLLAFVGAVAPFLAVVVVIGGGAWWARRRLRRGADGRGAAGPNPADAVGPGGS
jgi:hypothetical protein